MRIFRYAGYLRDFAITYTLAYPDQTSEKSHGHYRLLIALTLNSKTLDPEFESTEPEGKPVCRLSTVRLC